MKKFALVATILLAIASTTTSYAAWRKPVDAEPVVKFGQPVTGGTSNAVKYIVPYGTSIVAPADGVLVRSFGLLQTYKTPEGIYWEVFGVFNFTPSPSVKAGDTIGTAQYGPVSFLVSSTLPAAVNGRYTPTFVKPVATCLPVDYLNLEVL